MQKEEALAETQENDDQLFHIDCINVSSCMDSFRDAFKFTATKPLLAKFSVSAQKTVTAANVVPDMPRLHLIAPPPPPAAVLLSHKITLVPAIVFLIASCTSEFGLKDNID